MQKHAPSHLAAPQKKQRHFSSHFFTGLLLLILAAALALFLWMTFGTPEEASASGEDASAVSSALETEEADEDSADLALAQAQAYAAAQAADAIPTTLEELDWVTVDLIPLNEYSRPGVALDGVNAIVIHYVGNPDTTAQQNRDYYASLAETGSESVSSHFVIGIDGAIIQCIPLDEKSYCSNFRNSDTISIECCHSDTTGEFSDETIASLVKLVSYLADGYDLDYEDVIRHYDVTGKECPIYYVKNEDAWTDLKDKIFGIED